MRYSLSTVHGANAVRQLGPWRPFDYGRVSDTQRCDLRLCGQPSADGWNLGGEGSRSLCKDIYSSFWALVWQQGKNQSELDNKFTCGIIRTYILYKSTKMPNHCLTHVDLEQKTAVCAVCGPTRIYVFQYRGQTRRACVNKYRELAKEKYTRRKTEYWKTHQPKPRARSRSRVAPAPKPRHPRVYDSTAHVLSQVDDSRRTAVCSICGPVKMYVFFHGSYTTRRCAIANAQNTTAARRKRSDANKLFLDQYKISQGCQRCGYNASPIGLDLHHRNPAEKDLEIAKAVQCSRERLIQELEKCDVLCAICHRLVHDEIGYTT